jgi:hypothetical protein
MNIINHLVFGLDPNDPKNGKPEDWSEIEKSMFEAVGWRAFQVWQRVCALD